MIEKIVQEVFNSQERTQKITGKPSAELVNRIKDIREFQKTFGSYLSERPLVFQKFSFHGLLLAKEIISKAREEISTHCMDDLAKEFSVLEQKLEDIKKTKKLANDMR